MDSITNIQDAFALFFGIMVIVFFLMGVIISVKYKKESLDAKGAIIGLKKSILFYFFAIVSGAIMVFLSDQDFFYTALCFLIGGTAFIILFFGIQYLQMNLVLWRIEEQKKYVDANKEEGGKNDLE